MGFTLQLLEEKGYTGAQFMKDLGWVVVAIVSIAGAFMTVYAIYIAYLFATATDANKRKAAKDRLMKTVASALIVAACASILAVITVRFDTTEGSIEGPQGGEIGSMVSGIKYTDNPQLVLTGEINSSHGYTSLVYKGTINVNSRNLVNDKGEKIDPDGKSIVFSAGNKLTTAPGDAWRANYVPNSATAGRAKIEINLTAGVGAQNTIPMHVKCNTIERYGKTYQGFHLIINVNYTVKIDGTEQTYPINIGVDVIVDLSNLSESLQNNLILESIA